MKFILPLILILSFGLLSGQNSQEYIFKFNVKKWNREYEKVQKSSSHQNFPINLFDVYGKSVLFEVQERSISEVKIPDLKIFKGKSADDSKIISLTVLPKSFSGSYLQNGIQYFIEPVKGSCTKYKVYVRPNVDKKVEVGQINDFVK